MVARVGIQLAQQRAGGENIVAHRGVNPCGVARHGGRVGALFVEAHHLAIRPGFDHAELGGLFLRDRDRGDGGLGVLTHVVLEHLADIHPVDVIGPEDHHVMRISLLNQIDVLINSVGGALIPVFARRPHLRRHGNDEILPEQPAYFPSLAQMLQQGLAFELDQHINRIHAGVEEITEDEIHDAVTAAERDCGLGSFLREGIEPRSFSASQHERQDAHLHVESIVAAPPALSQTPAMWDSARVCPAVVWFYLRAD